MIDHIERAFRRILMVIGRGPVTFVNDAGNVQLLQVQLGKNEIREQLPRLAEFGLASNPPIGSDVLAVFIGGDRSNGAVVATGHQASRPKGLKAGEVCIYDDQGQSVYITRAGIVINGGGKSVNIINAPKVLHDGVNIGKDHTHGGVSSGGSNTGAPV